VNQKLSRGPEIRASWAVLIYKDDREEETW